MKNAVKLPKVIIDRKSWCRGNMCDAGTGRCCAIGFVAKAQLKKEGIRRPTAEQIENRGNEIEPKFPGVITANDDLSGKERIKRLRECFKDAGYQLVLVN